MKMNQIAWAEGAAKERQDREVSWRLLQLSALQRGTGTGREETGGRHFVRRVGGREAGRSGE